MYLNAQHVLTFCSIDITYSKHQFIKEEPGLTSCYDHTKTSRSIVCLQSCYVLPVLVQQAIQRIHHRWTNYRQVTKVLVWVSAREPWMKFTLKRSSYKLTSSTQQYNMTGSIKINTALKWALISLTNGTWILKAYRF